MKLSHGCADLQPYSPWGTGKDHRPLQGFVAVSCWFQSSKKCQDRIPFGLGFKAFNSEKRNLVTPGPSEPPKIKTQL